jgi:organic hydroperoxide reductase OsmC/OhrA
LPECIRLFYVRGVAAVGEDLLAVATAACHVVAEGYLKAALAKDRS